MENEQQLLREILRTQREMLNEMKAMRMLLEQQSAVSCAASKIRPEMENSPGVSQMSLDGGGGEALVNALVKRNRMAQDAMSFSKRTKK